MRQSKLGHLFTTLGILALSIFLNSCQGVALLDPQGPVGTQTRDLILMAVGLGMIVILPVFFMVFWFSYRYSEKNKKATYKPHWEGGFRIEAVLWSVPILIILVLSYLTWVKTIDLDPYKPLPSDQPPVKVQVISLDWNWLFIYPEYNIATLNKLVMPTGANISFELTSGTVMTSFFIPELGSQIYVMAGMTTKLNLLADKPGKFTGYNMGFSGDGYSSMHFPAHSVSRAEFDQWVQEVKGSAANLSLEEFKTLNFTRKKIVDATFGTVESDLFRKVVNIFMDTSGHQMTKPESAVNNGHQGSSPVHNSNTH